MDYTHDTTTPQAPNPDPCEMQSVPMALASLILGIIALLTAGCIYLAMVCGALGIILALLSKGGSLTLHPKARAGLALSSAGLILTFVIYIMAFLFILSYYGGLDGLMQEYMNLYQVDSIEELYRIMGVQ